MSKFRVGDASYLKATICGIEYTWVGGYGALLQSNERDVKQNDVRMIGNVVFYAWRVSKEGWRRVVSWCPQQDIDANFIREFKAELFA